MKLVCKLIKTKQFSKLSCKRFILVRLVKDSICFLAPLFHFLSIHVKKTLISVTFVSLLIFLFPNNDYVGFFGTAFWLSWFTWVAIFFTLFITYHVLCGMTFRFLLFLCNDFTIVLLAFFLFQLTMASPIHTFGSCES